MARKPKPAAKPKAKPAAKAHPRSDDGNAFIPDPSEGPVLITDDYAEELGEEYVAGATSNDDVAREARDALTVDEIGGPFVETTTDEEMSADEDPGPPLAEALPSPNRGT